MDLWDKARSLARKIRARIFDIGAKKSYSQEGEDMILSRIFDGRRNGFYVDVGAHHPERFSNTKVFYDRGWMGINIEPNPDALKVFKWKRKRDINVQVGISDADRMLMYYTFDEPALNTFDRNLLDDRLTSTPYRLLGCIEIAVVRLDNLLAQYLPPGQKIDFLSIDVEGLDFAALKSNDWNLYRPHVVLVEELNRSLEDIMSSELVTFMREQRYLLIAKTFNTLIFEENEILSIVS